MLLKRFLYVTMLSFMVLFLGCSEKIEPGNLEQGKIKTVKARIAVAAVTRQPLSYEAVGTIKAGTISTLSSKIMGTVKAVFVQGGDTVKQGQRLVAIDDRQVSAQLREAEAAFAEARRGRTAAKAARNAAKAGADLAGATYNRYLNLMKDDSASRQEFDEIKSRHHQAQATLRKTDAMLAAAKQRIKQAEALVSAASVREKDALIRAPFDGKISAKMIDVGDLASPGKSLLVIEKIGNYFANLELPEHYIETVTLGKKVKVIIQALNNRSLDGAIEEIFPAANEKSLSFLIKVKLPGQKGLRSGMFARVLIPMDEADMLLIPSSSVIHSGQLTAIYIVDDKQTARYRLIRTGRLFEESIEILSGIKEGDRYVVIPPLTLSDGDRVEAAS